MIVEQKAASELKIEDKFLTTSAGEATVVSVTQRNGLICVKAKEHSGGFYFDGPERVYVVKASDA